MHPKLDPRSVPNPSHNTSTDMFPVEYVRALVHRLFSVTIPELQVIPLVGDASDRRYYRLLLAAPTDGIVSLVLMRLAQPYTEGELPFVNVQRYLEMIRIPVPRIFCDDSAHGFVLLEDLGDVTLEAGLARASRGQIHEWYRQALDILITLQYPAAQPRREACTAFRLAFDVDKLMWELDFFITHMLQGLCRRRLPTTSQATLRGQFFRVAAILARQPRVLTHRDYHSRNLMLQGERLRVIDFQDARLGPCQYDLASLLYDSYVVLPADLREELLAYYLDRKAEADGYAVERDEFGQLFDYMCLQRNLKALGTFAFQTMVRGNVRYVSSIAPTVAYVQAHLAKHPELGVLREILEEHLFAVAPGARPDGGMHTPDTSPAR